MMQIWRHLRTQNPEVVPSPVVLVSLADSISDDHHSTEIISESENKDDALVPAQPVTRSSRGIVKPNPKYALAVAASDILVP